MAENSSSNDNKQRVRLRVLGISYNQLQTGAYALLMAQEDGPYRIPIVIGTAEAHAIAIRLENITPPRPLTHDLFVSFAHSFGVRLKEVFIYNFADGIFSSELIFTDGERTVSLDARTSDAIAIALRTHSPIYTTQEIVTQTGFILETPAEHIDKDTDDEIDDDSIVDGDEEQQEFDEQDGESEEQPDARRTLYDDYIAPPKLENYAIEELERTLDKLVAEERYEEADRVSKILEEKKKARK